MATADLDGAILVVEDDEDIRYTVIDSLTDEGFHAVGAAGARMALEMLRTSSSRPSLILLDLMMPEMSGAEFRAEQLRDAALAQIPVLVLTAIANPDSVVAELKPAGCLRKPLKLQALLDAAGRFAEKKLSRGG